MLAKWCYFAKISFLRLSKIGLGFVNSSKPKQKDIIWVIRTTTRFILISWCSLPTFDLTWLGRTCSPAWSTLLYSNFSLSKEVKGWGLVLLVSPLPKCVYIQSPNHFLFSMFCFNSIINVKASILGIKKIPPTWHI